MLYSQADLFNRTPYQHLASIKPCCNDYTKTMWTNFPKVWPCNTGVKVVNCPKLASSQCATICVALLTYLHEMLLIQCLSPQLILPLSQSATAHAECSCISVQFHDMPIKRRRQPWYFAASKKHYVHTFTGLVHTRAGCIYRIPLPLSRETQFKNRSDRWVFSRISLSKPAHCTGMKY